MIERETESKKKEREREGICIRPMVGGLIFEWESMAILGALENSLQTPF